MTPDMKELPAELGALADRCERATGPDRDLDRLISLAVFDVERIRGSEPDGSEDGFYDLRGVLPSGWAFTASLDDAMTLVPEGVLLASLSDIAADGLTGCCIVSDTASSPVISHWGVPEEVGPRHEVMARALCAAALRVRAHTLTKEGTKP